MPRPINLDDPRGLTLFGHEATPHGLLVHAVPMPEGRDYAVAFVRAAMAVIDDPESLTETLRRAEKATEFIFLCFGERDTVIGLFANDPVTEMCTRLAPTQEILDALGALYSEILPIMRRDTMFQPTDLN